MKRILNIVPVPVPRDALDAYAAQLRAGIVHPAFDNEFISVRAGATRLASAYESTLADAFVLEAGCRAEKAGYAAVCVSSMSDSGVPALRSRLSIPVVGAGHAAMLTACLLGGRFSIIAMWSGHRSLYTRTLAEQGLTQRLASIRHIDTVPDPTALLAGKEDRVLPALEAACRRAVDEDGADVIVLGSTTMHAAHAALSERLEVPVVNPGVVAMKLCELLVLTDLAQSRSAYPAPAFVEDALFETVPSSPIVDR